MQRTFPPRREQQLRAMFSLLSQLPQGLWKMPTGASQLVGHLDIYMNSPLYTTSVKKCVSKWDSVQSIVHWNRPAPRVHLLHAIGEWPELFDGLENGGPA